MTDISDETILANRRKVIEYLKNPKLKKAIGVLKNSVGGRCCLGHMCDALGVIPTKAENGDWRYEGQKFALPQPIREAVGMYTTDGAFRAAEFQVYYKSVDGGSHSSLALLNDESGIMPNDIASILEKMVTGGDGTPWRAIKTQ